MNVKCPVMPGFFYSMILIMDYIEWIFKFIKLLSGKKLF